MHEMWSEESENTRSECSRARPVVDSHVRVPAVSYQTTTHIQSPIGRDELAGSGASRRVLQAA
jgi:hypothetical protein